MIRDQIRPSTPESDSMYIFFCFLKIIYINLIDLIFINQTPPNTPQRIRTAAQRNERDQRLLDSPVHRRTPQKCSIGSSCTSSC